MGAEAGWCGGLVHRRGDSVSVIDGILTVAILLLFLVILAVMREVVILRGEVTALSQLIVDPPVPSYLGQKLPRALARRLEEMAGGARAVEAGACGSLPQECVRRV